MFGRFFFLFALFSLVSEFAFAQKFPGYKVTALSNESRGYYFLCPIQLPAGNIAPTQMILDSTGKVVYYKPIPLIVNTSDFKIQQNGDITYNYHAQFYRMDSNFNIIDSILPKNGVTIDTHDFQILPNGHYLFIGSELVKMDLSAYKYFNKGTTYGSKNASVKCGVIQELDENKNVVFEWHCKNYYSFADVDPFFLSSPDNVDWNHMNAIALDKDGNILLSVRHFNEITKINRKDSSIIWRLGGKRNQFKFTNDSIMFFGQHDIRRINNGNITLYDNGRVEGPFHASTAKEYVLDEVNHTATLAWKYIQDSTLYSTGLGNVQRLSNGNTLVDYGDYIKSNIIFSVVNTAGSKVFEITSNDSLLSYRGFNYFTLPWKLNRPQITCSLSGGKYYLDAGAGHAKYLWSNGDTTQTIQVNGEDTFSVFVPIGKGGFISSLPFITSSHTNPCSFTSIKERVNSQSFSIYPNPIHDELIILTDDFTIRNYSYEIFDMLGNKVKASVDQPLEQRISISVNDLKNGIYMLNFDGIWKKFIKE